jgi:cytochrome c1
MGANHSADRSRRRGSASLLTGLLVVGLAAATTGGAASPAAGQELSRAARSGGPQVRLSFPARPNVCGAGDGILVRERGGSTMLMGVSTRGWRSWRDGEPPCETGDVQVSLELADDRIESVGLRVGSPDPDASGTDLGRQTGADAARFLLAEARTAAPDASRRLITAASLAADAETWPALLELARDRSLASRTRKSALHWLGRAAADEAVAAMGGIVRDRTEADEIREAAVFGLSQLDDGRGVPLLIDVVRTVPDARVRSRALFWLADSEDPRAIELFEEILTGS